MGLRRFAAALAAAFLLAFSIGSAQAQTYTYSVYVDTDANAATGCTLNFSNGSVTGAEQLLQATISGGQTPQVTQVTRAACVGGAFGAPIVVDGGYPVGLNNGDGGADVVELADSLVALHIGGARSVRLQFVAASATGQDLLTTSAGGGPIGIGLPQVSVPMFGLPALLLLGLVVALVGARAARRRMRHALLVFLAISGLAFAANFAADGQVGDWAGIGPSATDPIGDASSGESAIDIVSVRAAIENGKIFFRFDVVDAQFGVPVAQSTSASTNEDTAVTVTLTGTDPQALPLTFAISTPPAHGALGAVNSTGPTSATVLYTPAADYNGADSFQFTANDGTATSGPATATITITPVNDAPAVPAATFSVFENASNGTAVGTVVYTDVDTGQAHTFAITAGNTGGAFAINPTTGDITVANAGALNFQTQPTYTLTVQVTDDGTPPLSGSGTITINLTQINHAPSFTKGPDQTVLEDAGAQTVTPWATAISDGDGGGQTLNFQITANSNAALFSVAPAVSPTGTLTYTPAANANGTATITLALHDSGGTGNGGVDTSATQTFTITVTAVNDAPSFTKGPDQSVLEDVGPQTVPNWATAISAGPSDESSQTLNFLVSVGATTGNLAFTTAPAISPTGTLTYTPTAGTQGTATISVQLHDNGGTANSGVDTSPAQTFTITVAPVNHAPSFTKGPDQTVFEDAGAQTISPWATAISDGDGATQTLNFQITANSNAALFSVAPAVSPTGVLTYTPAPNANGSATITLNLHDNGGTANGGVDTSATQTFTITVTAVNDVPSFIKGADQSVAENAGAQTVPGWATAISAGPADESGQTLAFQVTGNTNAALFSSGPAVSPTGTLTYTPSGTATGTATITLVLKDNGGTANGGVDTSPPQTFTVTITAINHAPSFAKGPDQTVLEDAGAQTVSPWATAISDGDGNTQTLNFQVLGNTNPALFAAGPAVSPTGVLTYTPAANANGTATITIALHDDGGTVNGGVDTSASQTFTITVTAVNDAPSFTKGADQVVLEDSGAHSVAGWATAISPGPADESGQTVAFNVTGNTLPGLFAVAPSVAPNGTLTFTPAANASGTATITLVAQDNGGTANGGADTSAPQTFTITVTDVNDPPSFVKGPDESANDNAGAQTLANWATAISPGPPAEAGQTVTFVITGNTDPSLFSAGPAVSSAGTLTFTPATVPSGTHSATITLVAQDNGGTANGGVDTSAAQSFVISITHVNQPPTVTPPPALPVHTHIAVQVTDGGAGDLITASNVTDPDSTNFVIGGTVPTTTVAGGDLAIAANGSFNYNPPANFTGTDSFNYQVCDDGVPVGCSAPVTMQLTVAGPKIWFVDASVVTPGNGTLQKPFKTFASAVAVATSGSSIFLFQGAYTGGVTLANGVQVVGQAVDGVSFDAELAISPPSYSIARPAVNLGYATIDATTGVTLTVGTGDTLRGIQLTASGGASTRALFGTNFGTLTVYDDVVINSSKQALALTNGALAGDAGGPAVFTSTSSAGGVNGIALDTVTGTVDFGSGTLSGANGSTFLIANGTVATTYGGTITQANNFAAIDIQSHASGATVFNGAIDATSGTGVQLNNVDAAVTFNGVVNLHGGDAGIDVTNGSSGTFNFANNASSIVNPTGLAINVANSAATLTFPGAITKTNGGTAISASTNSGGTLTFSGTTKTLTSSTSDAILLNANTGATINFTNGGLVVNTTSGRGFVATGGGTVGVSGTGNTITSTTGVALDVANTTIGAGNLNFQSIAANGGANGIVLDTTGTSGGLIVTGTGAAGTGGTIRNMSGADGAIAGSGIYLNSTKNVSLAWMQLNDFQNFAIRGSGVDGFTLTNSVINGVNGDNASGPFNEGSVSFTNLVTSASVSGTTISGGFADNFRVVNTAGTLNRLTFSNVNIGANSTANGNDGVTLEAQATATLNATIQNSQFTSARGDLFQLNLLGTSHSDLVFTGNTLTNNHPAIATGGGGVTISGGDNSGAGSVLTFNIANNTFRDSDGHAVLIVKSTDPGNFSGTFDSNTIGTAGVANSGSKSGDGLKLQNAGLGSVTAAITNNQIFQYNNFGIEMETGGGATAMSGSLNTTITGNTVKNPGTGGLPMNGVHLNAGTVPADTYSVCTKIGGAGALRNDIVGSGANGGTDFRLRQRQSTTVRLPGYAGAATDTAAVIAFVQSLNIPTPTGLASAISPPGGGFVGGGTTCP